MASKVFALLCLVGTADGLVKRTGPSEGLAVGKLGSLAAGLTQAAVSDAMTLGSARALEDVKQLKEVARLAVADELGMSPNQAYSADMGKKALLAAGDIAGELVKVLSRPGDFDEDSDDTEAGDEADGELGAEWTALDREANRDYVQAQSSGKFEGAHAVQHLTDFYLKETEKGVEAEMAAIFGAEALDAPVASKEVLDTLGEIVAQAKDAFEENAAAASDDEDSQAFEVSKKAAARVEEASQAVEELKAEFKSGDSDEESESSEFDAELDSLADQVSVLVDGAWSRLKRALPDEEAVEAADDAAKAVGNVLDEAMDEEATPVEALGAVASHIAEAVADTLEDASAEEMGELAEVSAKAVETVLDAAAPAIQSLSEALLDAAEDDEEDDESSEEAEEGDELFAKVVGGVSEIVDAVSPVVQDLAEALDEEEDEEESGAEQPEEEQEEEDEEEELGMGKQEVAEEGNKTADEFADKVASGIAEIVDAVDPIVTDFVEAVAENATNDDEE